MVTKNTKYIIIFVSVVILFFILFFYTSFSQKVQSINHFSTTENMINHDDIELVVSRYNEDLEWLKEEPFNKYRVICYNKGKNDDFYKPPNMRIVNLENVGREGHTYFYHILNNYDTLANITMFLPGSCNYSYKNDLAKRWINEIEQNNSAVFIGEYYTEPGIQNAMYDFTMDEYQSTGISNQKMNPENKTFPSEIRPYGKWFEKHFGNIVIQYVASKCIFCVQNKNIIQHPKSYYEVFLQELNKHSNPEVGHYFERSWAAVFHPMDDVVFIPL